MSTALRNKLEKIARLLDRLGIELARGTPIIVEGQNDVKALDRLGLEGDVISAKSSGKSFVDVIDEIERRGKRRVILLMDFDRPGKEWTSRLVQDLEKMGIVPNLVFWRALIGIVRRDVKDIEGLATYVENLKRKIGG